MKYDYVDEVTIKKMVDQFYMKVRQEPHLGDVFNDMIGDTEAAWGPHLETMYQFWSSIMLTSGKYHGNPLQKHKAIPEFPEHLFDRWLELFHETAHQLHHPSIANIYIDKSQRIAQSLKAGLYWKP